MPDNARKDVEMAALVQDLDAYIAKDGTYPRVNVAVLKRARAALQASATRPAADPEAVPNQDEVDGMVTYLRRLADSQRSATGEHTTNSVVMEDAAAMLVALQASATRPAADPDEAVLREALAPFKSGGNWGAVKAWLIAGAPDRAKGLEAAKAITKWQAVADSALTSPARARGEG